MANNETENLDKVLDETLEDETIKSSLYLVLPCIRHLILFDNNISLDLTTLFNVMFLITLIISSTGK